MIAAGTSDPAVFCNLGILCKNSGRIDEALEHYEQALEEDHSEAFIIKASSRTSLIDLPNN